TTFKKNDGEKEDNNSSLQEGVKKVKKKPERSNVYTNPQANPQRNPNVDPKRREPLNDVEIKAIKEAHKRYPEFGAWNLSLLLSNEFAVHVSTMSILRVLNPERYKSSKIAEKVKFYEKPRPHVMYHADTMEVTLGNGSLIYQISVEDDYSRGYMALCVFPTKHSYFVILTLLRAFRLHSKPELFHHDNGGEYNNGVVSRLLRMLEVVDVPTEVENPKGNGKKERAHSQDRKYFYDKYQFLDIERVEKAIPEYIRFRNESKGQWARYGKTASSVLKDAEAKPLTDEELERVIRELYFEKVERKVKQNGKVKFAGKRYHVCKEMSGETVEMKVTLRGMEAWHNGAFVKRWKYWEYVLDIAADYMLEKCLL
ncbi:hypothetical protein C5S29_12410, partial [ANME-1 cluster archaeon GoMg3.2]|nr:hypothetical protein [ANME-1 cluster archaeon GoMg3.2]